MNTQSQLTLFMILGFVILLGFGLIYSINNIDTDKIQSEVEQTAKTSFSVDNLNFFLNSCFKNLALEGIDYVSTRGGWFTLPEKSYSYGIISTSYYFYEDHSLFPKISIIENSVSDYIKTYADSCLEDLENVTIVEVTDFQIKNVTTKILQNKIIITIDTPTKIKLSSTVHDLTKFVIELDDNKLYDVYNFNDYLIKKQTEDKYSICLSCIINNGTQNNLFTDIDNIGNNTLLFTVMYNNTKTNTLHKFIFANKYKQLACNSLPADAEESFLNRAIDYCVRQLIESYNYSFEVGDLVELNAYVGVPFNTKIVAKGINLEYKDYSNFFDINTKNGEIIFLPTEEQVGEHEFLVSIKDGLGNGKLKNIKINITKLENE